VEFQVKKNVNAGMHSYKGGRRNQTFPLVS